MFAILPGLVIGGIAAYWKHRQNERIEELQDDDDELYDDDEDDNVNEYVYNE